MISIGKRVQINAADDVHHGEVGSVHNLVPALALVLVKFENGDIEPYISSELKELED